LRSRAGNPIIVSMIGTSVGMAIVLLPLEIGDEPSR
jgi:hypothetical protein